MDGPAVGLVRIADAWVGRETAADREPVSGATRATDGKSHGRAESRPGHGSPPQRGCRAGGPGSNGSRERSFRPIHRSDKVETRFFRRSPRSRCRAARASWDPPAARARRGSPSARRRPDTARATAACRSRRGSAGSGRLVGAAARISSSITQAGICCRSSG